MANILSRMEQFLDHEGISHRSFSLSIGMSAAYFSNSIKKGSSPSGDLLATIVYVYPDLNLRWVLLGEGEMKIKEGSVNEPGIDYGKSGSIDDLIEQKIDLKLEAFSEAIKMVIAGQIDEEIERTRRAIGKKED